MTVPRRMARARRSPRAPFPAWPPGMASRPM
jgi:hypothetical protein